MTPEERDLLIEAWADGTLDAAGRERLAALAEGDAEVRRLLRSHEDLRLLLASAEVDQGTRTWAAVRHAITHGTSSRRQAVAADVVGRIRAPRRRLGLLAAAALLLGLGAWWWLRERPVADGEAPVLTVARQAWIVDGARRRAAVVGEHVPVGAALEVETGGEALLRYDDASTLLATGPTRLAVEMGAGKQVRLGDGRLAVAAWKQPPDRPLAVLLPQGQATALGTVFDLAVVGAGADLDVHDGMVALARSAGTSAVRAGQRLAAGAATPQAQVASGRFVPAAAAAYEAGRWLLDEGRPGDELWRRTPDEMLGMWRDVGLGGQPSQGLRMEARQDPAGPLLRLVNTSDRTTLWRLLTGPAPVPALAYRFRFRLVEGECVISPGDIVPKVGMPVLPAVGPVQALPSGRWVACELRYRRVGWESDGQVLFEQRLLVDGRVCFNGWVRGVPNGFTVIFGTGVCEISEVVIQRLDVGPGA